MPTVHLTATGKWKMPDGATSLASWSPQQQATHLLELALPKIVQTAFKGRGGRFEDEHVVVVPVATSGPCVNGRDMTIQVVIKRTDQLEDNLGAILKKLHEQIIKYLNQVTDADTANQASIEIEVIFNEGAGLHHANGKIVGEWQSENRNAALDHLG